MAVCALRLRGTALVLQLALVRIDAPVAPPPPPPPPPPPGLEELLLDLDKSNLQSTNFFFQNFYLGIKAFLSFRFALRDKCYLVKFAALVGKSFGIWPRRYL